MRKVYDPKMENTKIQIVSLEELTAYKLFYERLKNLMESQAFKEISSFNVPEMTKPLYNVIMFNKLYFMRHAKESRFFDNDCTVWVDAGCYRENISNYAGQLWPNGSSIKGDLPTFFSHHSDISFPDLKDHAMSQMRYIHGTCFAVPNHCLDELIDETEFTIDLCLKRGFIGSDEKMFDINVFRSPDHYHLHICSWREYLPFLVKKFVSTQ